MGLLFFFGKLFLLSYFSNLLFLLLLPLPLLLLLNVVVVGIEYGLASASLEAIR